MILNERILRLIVTLAKELHFGRAAATLHLSQPALSGTVKSLERDLGVRLFKRTSRSVELTEAGGLLAAEACRLIKESERLVALLRRSSTDTPGPLCIGYPATMNLHWLGALMAHARTAGFLAADLQFVSSDAANLHEDLAKRNLHAAFFTGHVSDPDLQSVALFREPFTAVVPSRHSLAHTASLALDQLRDEPVVWLRGDVNPLLHDGVMACCSARGYRPNIVQEVRTFHECLQFAREGLGITFLPLFMESPNGDDAAVFVSLTGGTLNVEYTLAYCRDGSSRGVEQFVRFVQDQVRVKTAAPRVPGAENRSPSAIDHLHQSITLINRYEKTND
jgi:DNA-binding transcriptional LysR family regulator